MGTLSARKANERALRRLASRQHGVFSTKQAHALGVGTEALRQMAQVGDVVRALPSVYRFESAPRSELQRLAMAQAWAGEGSAISHDTAGWMLGFGDRHSSQIHVTRPGLSRSPSPKIVVHRAHLIPADVSKVHGVAVTTMPRTVIDMAAVCPEEVVDIALDAAIRQGMSRRRFLDRLDDLAAPGRNGVGVIKKLVAERVIEQGLTESPFERLLLRALRKARLPIPVCQMELSDEDFSARVDFAYPAQRVVIEADGYRWHDGRVAWERDRARISELAARGWRVLLVTWLQLKYRVDEVIDRIRRALEVTVPAPAPDGLAASAAAQPLL